MVDKNAKIMDGAGPFFFEGNKIGILILHGGGGGSCADLKRLAEDLHKKGGYTISVPLLPGFGTKPEDLKNVTIEEWKSALDEETTILMDICDKIIVGGHSMGGILTIILAANYTLDAIFTISAPIGIQTFLFHLVPLFEIFKKYHAINSEQLKKETSGKWIGYNKIPLNIAKKIKKLMKDMKKSLHMVNCPTLLFQGRLDSEIKKKSMDYIFSNIATNYKKKIWLEQNSHPILNSPDHNQIVLETFNFINDICP
ncbi:MAG: alpha/beta fold hydrolase [Candidatus Lokiarchaeota archaeon]|nr:alpha/beta fold hydrolase [Candidatus Lokiarchaeota archaeon]